MTSLTTHKDGCPAIRGGMCLCVIHVGHGLHYGDCPSGDTYTSTPEPKAKERRERIATAVLAGFAASDNPPATSAVVSLQWADALIAELDK
jgi:hypothetical protein